MRPLVLLLILLFPVAAAAQQVTSVSPSSASPGQTVVLTGGSFPPDTRVRLGETSIRPDGVERNRLAFTVPPLPPGDYLLQVVEGKRGRGRQVFTLRVTSPVPEIASVSPSTVDVCRLQQGVRISVAGRFPTGTSILLDGAVVASGSGSEISFQAPPLRSGVHQIEASGPDGRRSLPHPLVADGVPRILGVEQREENVTSYELVVTGENFLFESTLVVNDIPVNSPLAVQGRENIPPELLPRKDSVRYVDCNTLVLTRHPYSTQPKAVTLQVVNPGGEQSRVYEVTIP